MSVGAGVVTYRAMIGNEAERDPAWVAAEWRVMLRAPRKITET
jgi:hypothetical protein